MRWLGGTKHRHESPYRQDNAVNHRQRPLKWDRNMKVSLGSSRPKTGGSAVRQGGAGRQGPVGRSIPGQKHLSGVLALTLQHCARVRFRTSGRLLGRRDTVRDCKEDAHNLKASTPPPLALWVLALVVSALRQLTRRS